MNRRFPDLRSQREIDEERKRDGAVMVANVVWGMVAILVLTLVLFG